MDENKILEDELLKDVTGGTTFNGLNFKSNFVTLMAVMAWAKGPVYAELLEKTKNCADVNEFKLMLQEYIGACPALATLIDNGDVEVLWENKSLIGL